MHQYPTKIHTPKNIPTVTQKVSCGFSTAKINPISMQLTTDIQENIYMKPNITISVTNTITNESKNFKQIIQSNKNQGYYGKELGVEFIFLSQ